MPLMNGDLKGGIKPMNGQARVRRTVIVTTGIVASMLLAACGGGSGSSAAGSQQSAAESQSPTELKAAAVKEGTVVWYTTFSAEDLNGMIDAFHKDYPKINVKPVRLTGAQVPARIATEQKGGKFAVDVASADAPQIMALVNSGALAPYEPPDQSPLPAGLKLPKGYTGVTYLLTAAIAYNPSVVKAQNLTPPTSWEDLTKPEWKGKFSVDPTAMDWYEMLIGSMGHDKALQLLRKLGDNRPRFVESHTEALTQVQSGEPAAAATIYGYKAASLHQKTPDQLQFVNPSPLPVALNLVDVVKNAPHPHAAKLFEDWLVSKDGQTAVVDVTNHTSIRDDVNNDKSVFDPSKWPPAWADSNIDNAKYNAYAAEMKQALKAP